MPRVVGEESRTPVEDVADIVELASAHAVAAEDTLSRDEVRAIGAEVGLAPSAIDAVIVSLAAVRDEERAERDARRAAMRRRLAIGAVAIAGTMGVAWIARSHALEERRATLAGAHAVVAEARANVGSARAAGDRRAPGPDDRRSAPAMRSGSARRIG